MSSFWNFVFGAILVIIWIIAGGYITQANIALGPHKNKDVELHRAYWFTFWGAFVTWTLIGIFIILIILSVIGVVALFGSGVGEAGVVAEEGGAIEGAGSSRYERGRAYAESPEGQANITTGISWLTIGFLVLALILVGITGVLAAIAASSMVKSPNYEPDDEKFKTAYNDCIISASMCLGAGGLLILGIIIYFIIGIQRQRKIDAEREKYDKYKQEELAGLRRLRQQEFRQKAEQRAAFEQQLQEVRQQALLQRAYRQTLQLQ